MSIFKWLNSFFPGVQSDAKYAIRNLYSFQDYHNQINAKRYCKVLSLPRKTTFLKLKHPVYINAVFSAIQPDANGSVCSDPKVIMG